LQSGVGEMLTPAMFSAYFPSFSPTMQPTPVLLDAKQGFFYSLKPSCIAGWFLYAGN